MKRKDAIKAVREASAEDLLGQVRRASDELLKIRCKQASGQHDGAGRRAQLRIEIARAKTEISARANKAQASVTK